jgi:hypothetical protein
MVPDVERLIETNTQAITLASRVSDGHCLVPSPAFLQAWLEQARGAARGQ